MNLGSYLRQYFVVDFWDEMEQGCPKCGPGIIFCWPSGFLLNWHTLTENVLFYSNFKTSTWFKLEKLTYCETELALFFKVSTEDVGNSTMFDYTDYDQYEALHGLYTSICGPLRQKFGHPWNRDLQGSQKIKILYLGSCSFFSKELNSDCLIEVKEIVVVKSYLLVCYLFFSCTKFFRYWCG